MRPYGLILAATLAALAIGYWTGQHTPFASEPAAAESTLGVDSVATRKAKNAGAVAARTHGAAPAVAAVPGATTAASPTAHASSRPLPPPGTPLKQVLDELQQDAAAGDATAASRLYNDMQRCADARRINASIPRLAEAVLNQKTDSMNADQLKIRERQIASYNRQLKFANDSAALCMDLSDDQINQLEPASMQAALLGDQGAANCFVSGGATYGFGVPAGLLDHPEWLADYKQNALNVANAALQSGDWQMVGMLYSAYGSASGNTMLSQLTGQDPAMAYRYQKLLSMRNPGARSINPNSPSPMQEQLDKNAAQITPQARAEADAWAQQEYQQYFSATAQAQPSQRYLLPCQSEELQQPVLTR